MFKISDDKKTVTLKINSTASPTDVETLIADLAEIRATMLPAVPTNRAALVDPANQTPNISAQTDPHAEVRRLRSGEIRFWFRNQGIGWLAFNVPIEKACAMRDYLIANTPAGHPGPNLFRDQGGGGNTAH